MITHKQAHLMMTLETTRDLKNALRSEVEMCRRLEAKGFVFGVGLRLAKLTNAGKQALETYRRAHDLGTTTAFDKRIGPVEILLDEIGGSK